MENSNHSQSEIYRRAETACASGAIFDFAVGPQGNLISFEKAYPDAPQWMKKLAASLRSIADKEAP